MVINEKSPKDEIIDHACEMIDDQTTKINRLNGDRRALIVALAFTICLTTLF